MQPSWIISIRKWNSKVSNGIDQLAGFAAVILCSVMTIVVLLGVFFRYVLTDPLVWSEELSTFAMVWVTMIGGSMGIKRYSHVGVSYVVDNIPFLDRHRNAVGVLVNLLILFFLAIRPGFWIEALSGLLSCLQRHYREFLWSSRVFFDVPRVIFPTQQQ